MKLEVVTGNVWPELTKALRKNRRPAAVAVAYFGRGGAKRLPLRPGSRLVVDASEATVKSGQTCPAELAKLARRDVRVYSVANLHAKVFVLGGKAIIGSANVSDRSAGYLIEVAVITTDREAVKCVRTFVLGLCQQELGPEAIKRLSRMYRPPRVPGGRRRPTARPEGRVRVEIRPLRVAQLKLQDPPPGSESAWEAGRQVAKRRRRHSRNYRIEDFWWRGRCSFELGDVVVQALDEGGGKVMFSPPGNVINIRRWRRGKTERTFVYLEVPDNRRKSLKHLAKRVGQRAARRLRRGGLIRDPEFAAALMGAWES